MATCRIVIESNGLDAAVYSPYDYKEVVKSFPGRRYDKTRKCWIVAVAFVNPLADALRGAGVQVFVTDAQGNPWRGSSSKAHGHRDQPAADWVEQAFKAVRPDKADKLRRGLLLAFHPDHGGSHDISVRINQAADRTLGGRHG